MACFLIPAAEAIATTVVTQVLKQREKKTDVPAVTQFDGAVSRKPLVPFSRKLSWLNNMLWGGSALLAFEHVWHGEVVPFFPFLSAAGNPESAREMLHEMATAGVTMSLIVTAVWIGMVAVSSVMEKSRGNSVSAAAR